LLASVFSERGEENKTAEIEAPGNKSGILFLGIIWEFERARFLYFLGLLFFSSCLLSSRGLVCIIHCLLSPGRRGIMKGGKCRQMWTTASMEEKKEAQSERQENHQRGCYYRYEERIKCRENWHAQQKLICLRFISSIRVFSWFVSLAK
jgi:hypothetical protein